MLVYWEQNAIGVQKENFDRKEDDDGCEIQKPQMKKKIDYRSNSEHSLYFQFVDEQ
jgi:hypothetical protein